VGPRGFWDEQLTVTKLKGKKPVLQRLAESILWESFRTLLDKGYTQERKSNAGRKRIDPLILFKILVLQQLFNLSDVEFEFQVNDRRSFEELFEMFEGYLRSQGLQARGGLIIAATLVPVP
jgi:hypothetical protein